MEIEIKNNDIILHGVKCLDLELTLDCGQAFRWVKEKDASFSGVASGVIQNINKIGEDNFLLKERREKDFKKIKKQNKELNILKKVIDMLANDEILRTNIVIIC